MNCTYAAYQVQQATSPPVATGADFLEVKCYITKQILSALVQYLLHLINHYFGGCIHVRELTQRLPLRSIKYLSELCKFFERKLMQAI